MILRSPRLRGASSEEEAAADELIDGSDDAGSVGSWFSHPPARIFVGHLARANRDQRTSFTNAVDTAGDPESRRPSVSRAAPQTCVQAPWSLGLPRTLGEIPRPRQHASAPRRSASTTV